MSNAIDTPSRVTPTAALSLFKGGITHVGRYLGHDAKCINKAEADAIKAVGLQIFSIYEANPTQVSYFTADRGKHDALAAAGYAQEIGQPSGTAIYFTVDYDAQPKDYNEILAYFQAVKATLKGYEVGAYGSYSVLNFLQSKSVAKYFMQTYAWSNGNRCKFNHIYQYKNDQKQSGLDVDFDYIEQADCGSWGKAQPVQPPKTDIKPAANTAPTASKGDWKKENSIWYYYEGNTKRIGWLQDGGKWYYLKEVTGQMVVGWYKVAETWYYFDVHGVMQTGWIMDKGKKYYLDAKGKMVTGQQIIEGKTYTFASSGALQ